MSISLPTLAANSTSLDKMEDSVLGTNYPNDKIEKRVDRLEKTVYGKQKAGSVDARLAKLAKDTSADVIGQEIAPSKDTFKNENDDIAKSDGTENYPIINDIEQKLFNKTTPERSLHTRMANIEKKMFNKTYETDDYYARMERIKSEYYAQNPPIAQNQQSSQDDNLAYGDDTGGLSSPNYSNYTGGSADLGNTSDSNNADDIKSYYGTPQMNDYAMHPNSKPFTTVNSQDEYELSTLEQRLLNNTYPDQSMNERLSRLETKVFDTDFFYDDEKIRLDRIESASKAKKTSKKYDSNKFYSKLNTALQIGTMMLMVLAFIL